MNARIATLFSSVLLALLTGQEWAQAQTVTATTQQPQTATGIVYEDQNKNGQHDEGEPLLAGIRISNGHDIVKTNAEGRYELPVTEDQIVFVIKPAGYKTRINRDGLPQFYYIHKPAGSPKLYFPGVQPTGPLPTSIDFPLYASLEPETFKAILFGDPQPRDLKEVSYIAEDIIPDLIGTDASFGVTLGDIVFDDLTCFQAVNETYGLVGIPWYNVIGNHDINYDVDERRYANETFEATYGPSYYSFDYGKVHFVVTDNINFHVDPADGKRKYDAMFGKTQLEFIQKDLAEVPQDHLVVLMMHIPLENTKDRESLYRLIEKRPFCISISGHTHFHAHRYIDATDGWQGDKPHHHIINVTVSGSWWGGQSDERGIPHTVMCDGAPNGYSIMQFDDTHYQLDFIPAGRSPDYQMNINIPDEVQVSKMAATEVVVNVFNAAPQDKVEARIGVDGDWKSLDNFTGISPMFAEMHARDRNSNGDPTLPTPRETTHLWKLPMGELKDSLTPGHYLLQVRWTDRNGRNRVGNRVLRVIPNSETKDAKPADVTGS